MLTPDTNLSAFDKFEVTVTDPAGNLYQTIVIDAELKDGYVWEDAPLTGSNNARIGRC